MVNRSFPKIQPHCPVQNALAKAEMAGQVQGAPHSCIAEQGNRIGNANEELGQILTTLPRRSARGLLITGAQGHVGRALRQVYAMGPSPDLPVLWHGRRPGPGVDLAWDIGAGDAPELPRGLIILHLAARLKGTAAELRDNSHSTRALCQAALRADAAHVFVMSSAAVYAPGPGDLAETAPTVPTGPYGQSKLDAEKIAEQVLPNSGLTLLRLANLAGADTLFHAMRQGGPITLDPIDGQVGGPHRSFIGPRSLAECLRALVGLAAEGRALPRVLNLAQPGVMAMADILDAAGCPWSYGPPRAAAIPRVVVATGLLQSLVRLPHAFAAGLVAEVGSLPGWPQ